MKILIIGKGGREHAIAWKLGQNPRITQVYIAEGNPACELLEYVECVKLNTIPDLVEFAKQKQIDLTFVGSEELLVAGIVDQFEANNLVIFGPNKKAAQLEGSKVYSKEFMNKYGIKTAEHQSFDDYAEALKYLDKINYPIVIKASGLAAGKGVIIAQDRNEAETTLAAMLLDMAFGESGSEVVIEEFLVGVEASILAFTDSQVIVPLISAKDHKKIGDNETGLNTGGMGVIAPNPYFTVEANELFIRDILEPTLRGIQAEQMNFAGVIFFGVMITNHGVYLIEYNMRMGDPETQAVLPLMESDLLELIEATVERRLADFELKWHSGATCCIVLASGGYPEKFPIDIEINGLENFDEANCQLFAAGVGAKDGKFVTKGGRVLNIVGHGVDMPSARAAAYSAIPAIKFAGCYYRSDIGKLD